jgi:acyl carrier protein
MSSDTIVDIYRRVLETDDLGPGTDFFDAGGDSLLATRVLSALARTYGVELSFEDFLLAPTPAALAERVAAATVAGSVTGVAL